MYAIRSYYAGLPDYLKNITCEKSDPMSFFRVENISKSFGGVQAVRDLSFEVRKGEIYSIIGPNGAGKSTVFVITSYSIHYTKLYEKTSLPSGT